MYRYYVLPQIKLEIKCPGKNNKDTVDHDKINKQKEQFRIFWPDF